MAITVTLIIVAVALIGGAVWFGGHLHGSRARQTRQRAEQRAALKGYPTTIRAKRPRMVRWL